MTNIIDFKKILEAKRKIFGQGLNFMICSCEGGEEEGFAPLCVGEKPIALICMACGDEYNL